MKVDIELIKKSREKKNITAKELASMIKKNKQYMDKIEQGRRDPSLETAYDIARALEIPISLLVISEMPTGPKGILTVGGETFDVPAELLDLFIQMINNFNRSH